LVSRAVQNNQSLLSKTFREMSLKRISDELLIQTNQSGLTFRNDSLIIVTPLFARFNGEFSQNN